MNKVKYDIMGIPLFQIPTQFGTEEKWQEEFTVETLFKEFTSDEYGDNQLPHRTGLSMIRKLGGRSNLHRIKLESDYLWYLTYEKARVIYGTPIPEEVDCRLRYELHILKVKGFSNYYLFAQDFVNSLTNDLGVFVTSFQGRESCSLVAYCLGITKVDPLEYDLLFEYYLNVFSNRFYYMCFRIDEEGIKQAKEWLNRKYGEWYWLHFPFTSDSKLTCIRNIYKEIESKHEIDYKWNKIPLDDKNALKVIKSGGYNGYWFSENQLLSSGQFEISSFADYILLASFIDANLQYYIDLYVERKKGEKACYYDIPRMEIFLRDTCGILVYEEQLYLLSRLLADFNRQEGSELIRVLRNGHSMKKRMAEMFLKRGKRNGHDTQTLLKIWSDWCRYSKTIICKSSVVSEAWVSYQLAYLKANFPKEFDSVMF